ncbi:hypothetical protein VTO73DRAFT_4597 [Trametes versicolor]
MPMRRRSRSPPPADDPTLVPTAPNTPTSLSPSPLPSSQPRVWESQAMEGTGSYSDELEEGEIRPEPWQPARPPTPVPVLFGSPAFSLLNEDDDLASYEEACASDGRAPPALPVPTDIPQLVSVSLPHIINLGVDLADYNIPELSGEPESSRTLLELLDESDSDSEGIDHNGQVPTEPNSPRLVPPMSLPAVEDGLDTSGLATQPNSPTLSSRHRSLPPAGPEETIDPQALELQADELIREAIGEAKSAESEEGEHEICMPTPQRAAPPPSISLPILTSAVDELDFTSLSIHPPPAVPAPTTLPSTLAPTPVLRRIRPGPNFATVASTPITLPSLSSLSLDDATPTEGANSREISAQSVVYGIPQVQQPQSAGPSSQAPGGGEWLDKHEVPPSGAPPAPTSPPTPIPAMFSTHPPRYLFPTAFPPPSPAVHQFSDAMMVASEHDMAEMQVDDDGPLVRLPIVQAPRRHTMWRQRAVLQRRHLVNIRRPVPPRISRVLSSPSRPLALPRRTRARTRHTVRDTHRAVRRAVVRRVRARVALRRSRRRSIISPQYVGGVPMVVEDPDPYNYDSDGDVDMGFGFARSRLEAGPSTHSRSAVALPEEDIVLFDVEDAVVVPSAPLSTYLPTQHVATAQLSMSAVSATVAAEVVEPPTAMAAPTEAAPTAAAPAFNAASSVTTPPATNNGLIANVTELPLPAITPATLPSAVVARAIPVLDFLAPLLSSEEAGCSALEDDEDDPSQWEVVVAPLPQAAPLVPASTEGPAVNSGPIDTMVSESSSVLPSSSQMETETNVAASEQAPIDTTPTRSFTPPRVEQAAPLQPALTSAARPSVEGIDTEAQPVEQEAPPAPRLDKGKSRAVEPLLDSPSRTPALPLPMSEEERAYNLNQATWDAFVPLPEEDSPPAPIDFSKPGPSNQLGTNQRLYNVPAVEVRGIVRCTTIPILRRINSDNGFARPALDSDVEIRIVVEPAMHDSPRDCVDESMDSAVAEQLRTPSPVEVAHVPTMIPSIEVTPPSPFGQPISVPPKSADLYIAASPEDDPFMEAASAVLSSQQSDDDEDDTGFPIPRWQVSEMQRQAEPHDQRSAEPAEPRALRPLPKRLARAVEPREPRPSRPLPKRIAHPTPPTPPPVLVSSFSALSGALGSEGLGWTGMTRTPGLAVIPRDGTGIIESAPVPQSEPLPEPEPLSPADNSPTPESASTEEASSPASSCISFYSEDQDPEDAVSRRATAFSLLALAQQPAADAGVPAHNKVPTYQGFAQTVAASERHFTPTPLVEEPRRREEDEAALTLLQCHAVARVTCARPNSDPPAASASTIDREDREVEMSAEVDASTSDVHSEAAVLPSPAPNQDMQVESSVGGEHADSASGGDAAQSEDAEMALVEQAMEVLVEPFFVNSPAGADILSELKEAMKTVDQLLRDDVQNQPFDLLDSEMASAPHALSEHEHEPMVDIVSPDSEAVDRTLASSNGDMDDVVGEDTSDLNRAPDDEHHTDETLDDSDAQPLVSSPADDPTTTVATSSPGEISPTAVVIREQEASPNNVVAAEEAEQDPELQSAYESPEESQCPPPSPAQDPPVLPNRVAVTHDDAASAVTTEAQTTSANSVPEPDPLEIACVPTADDEAVGSPASTEAEPSSADTVTCTQAEEAKPSADTTATKGTDAQEIEEAQDKEADSSSPPSFPLTTPEQSSVGDLVNPDPSAETDQASTPERDSPSDEQSGQPELVQQPDVPLPRETVTTDSESASVQRSPLASSTSPSPPSSPRAARSDSPRRLVHRYVLGGPLPRYLPAAPYVKLSRKQRTAQTRPARQVRRQLVENLPAAVVAEMIASESCTDSESESEAESDTSPARSVIAPRQEQATQTDPPCEPELKACGVQTSDLGAQTSPARSGRSSSSRRDASCQTDLVNVGIEAGSTPPRPYTDRPIRSLPSRHTERVNPKTQTESAELKPEKGQDAKEGTKASHSAAKPRVSQPTGASHKPTAPPCTPHAGPSGCGVPEYCSGDSSVDDGYECESEASSPTPPPPPPTKRANVRSRRTGGHVPEPVSEREGHPSGEGLGSSGFIGPSVVLFCAFMLDRLVASLF